MRWVYNALFYETQGVSTRFQISKVRFTRP